MSDIGIIGAGSFGTALAISLAKENHNVNLWARSETQIKEMLELNENKKFLPGITFPKTLRPILDFRDLECCSIILIAIPTQSLNQFFYCMILNLIIYQWWHVAKELNLKQGTFQLR
jgi:glycerol-3-phosphate dehydrogenase (NAD(P)+)